APERAASGRRGRSQRRPRVRDVTMDERWRSLFQEYSNSSFMDVLRRESPPLIPGHETPRLADVVEPVHGTTVLSVRYRDGVIMAGDRQATAGYQGASPH